MLVPRFDRDFAQALGSGFGRVFAAGEAGRGAQLGARDLGVGAGSGLRRRCGRRARLFRQRFVFHQEFHFDGVDDFAFEQGLRDAFERFAIVVEKMLRLVVAAVDDALYFLVDLNGGVFGIIAVLSDFAAEENGFVFLAE